MEEKGIALETAMVAALEGIEGLPGRVCPVVDIHKSTGPLVVYDPRRESEERSIDGREGLLFAETIVHVLHNGYKKMRLLCEDVKAALEALEGLDKAPLLIEAVEVELATPDIHEQKVELFRRTYNVKFYYQIKED